jgi:hypothetical protein
VINDPLTSWVEIIKVENKTAKNVSALCETDWIYHYPKPKRCIYDAGSAFIAFEFQELLKKWNVHPEQEQFAKLRAPGALTQN